MATRKKTEEVAAEEQFEQETEQVTVTKSREGTFQVLQAPIFQHTMGGYEAVARLSDGRKVTAYSDSPERTWEALQINLEAEGESGRANTEADLGNPSSSHIDGGQKYNSWLDAQAEGE